MPKCDFNKSNFIKITLRHGCYPVNLMNILRTPMEACFSIGMEDTLTLYRIETLKHFVMFRGLFIGP